MISLPMNRLFLYSLLFIVFYIRCISAAIYYEKPSSARLAAASQKPPACTYQNQKYQHGQQVPTPEPCLNCTCRKGVLLCFLRVCPTLIQLNPSENCITVREPGQCCPTLKCEKITQNDISNTTPSVPSTKSLSGFSQTLNNESSNTERTDVLNGGGLTTEDNRNSIHYFSDFKNLKEESEKSFETRNDERVSVTQKDITTTIFQTSPSTTFHESLLLVTSSPASTLVDSEDNLITSAEGSCLINGTVYAEGSAVISTSFCEYCYCIRSKRMCIRPRCHLSILGCLPRYTSEYACCPTSYVCGEEALTTLPMTTTTTTTTTTTVSTVDPGRLLGRKSACIINGVEYKVGEPIASDEDCKQCYCSTGGIKKCKKIQCSPQIEGCVPIIPEGHCCPVEYKCNSTLDSTKSSLFLEINTNIDQNRDLSSTTTQQNIIDLTEIGISFNPNDSSDQLTTETLLEANDKQVIDEEITNSSNSSQTFLTTNKDIGIDSATGSPLEETDTKNTEPMVEELIIQTENTINGQQLRSDDMVLKIEEQNSSLNNESNKTDISIDTILETTTDINDKQSIDFVKNNIKPDLYSENKTIIKNDIEITTQNVPTFTTEQSSNSYTSPTPETSLSPIKNVLLEKSDEFVKNISNDSLNVSMKTIVPNEENDTKPVQNETSYDSVGVILQGIIHAIDKQLQRRIPAEPRLKNNSSDETSDDKHSSESNNATQKPITYRSENKAGPSLSSSFFITDDNEPPYKADSDSVEIITAKTAFFDLQENPLNHDGDSILINLAPSTMKVNSSPFNPNSSPNKPSVSASNDKKFDVIAQNNRAAIYGRPANPFPQQYLQTNNDWKVVNSDFPRKPQYEAHPSPSKPIDSLYYNQNNNRREDSDSDETLDQNNSDFDKRPRLEFDNPMDINNRMKVIPFKVNDAVGGLSHKRKNGSFLIRVSTPNKNSLAPDLNSKSNQQISCFFNNLEYPNGAMIPKSDPCTLCRCFYGRELCQQQKCPAPPEKDCVPEKMNGYCCPRYICRIIDETKITPNSQPIDGLVLPNPDLINSSPIRKSPQFLTEIKNNFNSNNLMNETNSEMGFLGVPFHNQENNVKDQNINEDKKNPIPLVGDLATPPNRHISPTVDPSIKPFQRISGFKPKPNENRIHFPNEKDSVVSQPLISDSISPFVQTNSRPSKPIGSSHPSQYNNANKFRLKPSPSMSQPSQSMSPFGSPQKPNLRLPPFLLHTHSGSNSPSPNRQKPNIPSPHHSEDILTKSETINRNNISMADNENISALNSTDLPNNIKNDSNHGLNGLTPEYHSTTSSSQPIHSSTAASSVRQSSTPIFVFSTVSTTSMTPIDSKPKEQKIKTSIDSNENQNKNQNKNNQNNDNPWDIFKVSSCNIYGTMYEINSKIDRLSTPCKNCICSVQGVKCTDIC